MAARGRFRSYAQLLTVLKGINGPSGGYWFDLKRAVYTKLVRPEDDVTGIPERYLCMPLVGAAPSYESDQRNLTIATWRQRIYGFDVEKADEGLDSDLAPNLLKLHDDIQRAVLLDHTLGGTVDDTEWVDGGDETAGVFLEDDYGELQLVLRLTTRYGAADLGSLAT